MSDYDALLAAPMCRLGANFDGPVLIRLDFLTGDGPVSARLDARAARLADALDAYWADPAHVFDLPYRADGTPFRRRVWQALCAIPPGQPTTYGALARQLGSAARAVGQACGANPLPLLIPCHRVRAAKGLGGFMHHAAGSPLTIKSRLLEHEARCTPSR